MINTYNLFAVSVTHGKFVVPIDIYKKIIKFVDENYNNSNSTFSCVNGFQTHDNFDGKNELNEELNLHLKNYFKLFIDHGWLNVLGNNSLNIPHKHLALNVRYAGVLYLSSENNNITFIKDDEIFEIRPKLFDYLIFPSNLVHYVLSEKREEKRICYAFNMSPLI
tara:strand:+ start:52 stop:546 length:495 start_codon:yes stop_codon:yes gene_type:complete